MGEIALLAQAMGACGVLLQQTLGAAVLMGAAWIMGAGDIAGKILLIVLLILMG